MDNRLDGFPLEFSAANLDEAVQIAAGLYAARDLDTQHGVEIWAGTSRVFIGNPLLASRSKAAA